MLRLSIRFNLVIQRLFWIIPMAACGNQEDW
jgi:hypothetical protein